MPTDLDIARALQLVANLIEFPATKLVRDGYTAKTATMRVGSLTVTGLEILLRGSYGYRYFVLDRRFTKNERNAVVAL